MYPEIKTQFVYDDEEYEVFGTLECESPFSTYRENDQVYVEFFDDAVISNIHYFTDYEGDQVNLTEGELHDVALECLIDAHEDEVREKFEEDNIYE